MIIGVGMQQGLRQDVHVEAATKPIIHGTATRPLLHRRRPEADATWGQPRGRCYMKAATRPMLNINLKGKIGLLRHFFRGSPIIELLG